MPRAIWKGSISFGLVTIPVELHTAVRDHRPKFRMLHAKDKSPVKFQRELPVPTGAMSGTAALQEAQRRPRSISGVRLRSHPPFQRNFDEVPAIRVL